jgi:hypothetical protein
VRIRIPKKKPEEEPEEDEEGNIIEKHYEEEELEEMPIDDKCHSIMTRSNGQSIYCLN